MSKNTRNYTSRSKYTRSGGYGEYYIDGNTARKIDVRKEIHKLPHRLRIRMFSGESEKDMYI